MPIKIVTVVTDSSNTDHKKTEKQNNGHRSQRIPKSH